MGDIGGGVLFFYRILSFFVGKPVLGVKKRCVVIKIFDILTNIC